MRSLVGDLENIFKCRSLFKRGKRTLTKRKVLDWSRYLDIDTLNERNCWATLSELSKVVPFHSDRYDDILRQAKDGSRLDTKTRGELTFATRFIAVYLFTKVKGSRPMTYQFLTIPMLEKAKDNGGYVDQTKFKTAEQYMFDSVAFDEPSLTMLDQYVKHIRPLLQARCKYVLVTKIRPSIVNCVILCQFCCLKLLVNIFIQLGFNRLSRLRVPTACQLKRKI